MDVGRRSKGIMYRWIFCINFLWKNSIFLLLALTHTHMSIIIRALCISSTCLFASVGCKEESRGRGNVKALFVQREEYIMTCPRCGNEWDVSKSPCTRCGLLVHLPNSLRSATRTSPLDQKRQESSSGRNNSPGEFSARPGESRPPNPGSSLSSAQQGPLQSGVYPQKPPSGSPFEQTGSLPAWGIGASQGTQETPLPAMRDNIDMSSFRESPAGQPRSEPSSSFNKLPFGDGSEGNMPSRPNPPSQAGQMRSSGAENVVQPSLRAKRLVTDSKRELGQARPAGNAEVGANWETSATPFRSLDNQRESVSEDQVRVLLPGTTLRNG